MSTPSAMALVIPLLLVLASLVRGQPMPFAPGSGSAADTAPAASVPAEPAARAAAAAPVEGPARALPGEPGWLRRRICLGGNGSDTLAPPGGLGSVARLKVERGGQALLPDQDYRVAPGDSALVFAAPVPPSDTLCLDRATSPLLARPRLRLYRMDRVPVLPAGPLDPGAQGIPAGPSPFAPADADSLGAYRLNYSGSKSMAVTMGSGGGLGLDAALYIDLEGQVAEDVFVEGQLSDQNVPVQPEGNTATLKEVDTKFIRVHGRDYSFTLGDYLLEHGIEGEDRFRGRVEGLTGRWRRGQYGLRGAWSLAEGQYASDTLRGVDGKQRGYYLRGRDGRQFITVLAGTERIWRNGAALRRGTDYTIDYSEGRVDFLNTLVVTGENLFSAEFQYTEQDWGRSLSAGEARDTAGAFTWSVRGIHELEDKGNPLSSALGPELRSRLAARGDAPLVDSSGRRVAAPASQGLAAASAGFAAGGHASRASLLVSSLDRNLLSSRDDDDNLGYATRYLGTQGLGATLDKGGLGRAEVRLEHEFRSERYAGFKQLIEPRTFLETWNLDAEAGERGFLANRLRLEYRPWARVLVGAEAGRAGTVGDPRADPALLPAGDTSAPTRALPEVLSRRGAVFGRLGGEKTFLEASTEAKLARSPERRDNWRQAGRLRLEAAGLIPSFTFVRNEWAALRPGGALARSVKQEPAALLSSRPLLGHFAFATGTSLLLHRSDFDGRLPALRDSVRDWGATQKLEVLALGPWTSDVFYSYRNHREWRLDAGGSWSPAPQESDFHQVEWNSQLSDHRRGYGLVTGYRASRTAELPLVQVFDSVGPGRGDYVYDDRLKDYQPVETGGTHVLVGLGRDTTLGTRPYQDLGFTANLELAPGRFPFAVKGVLADIELVVDLAFDHQDSSGRVSLLPLLTDEAIEEVRSGRSRYSPSLHWRSPAGRKALNLRVDRAYARAAGLYAYRERRLDERADWRREVGERWEYALEQAYEDRFRQGLSGQGGISESEGWTWGARLVRRLPRSFSLEGRAHYQDVSGSAPEGDLDLQGVKPALRLEKSSLYNGRAYLEYGAIYFWGSGQGNVYATGGYRRGLTHRLEANAHFQVGEHMHLNVDYVVRLEPGETSPEQKMTAEARAVF